MEPCDNAEMYPPILDVLNWHIPRLYSNSWPLLGHASETYSTDPTCAGRYLWELKHNVEIWQPPPLTVDALEQTGHTRLIQRTTLPRVAGYWLDLKRCNECYRKHSKIVTFCAMHRVATCIDCCHTGRAACTHVNAVWLLLDNEDGEESDFTELQTIIAWQWRSWGLAFVKDVCFHCFLKCV